MRRLIQFTPYALRTTPYDYKSLRRRVVARNAIESRTIYGSLGKAFLNLLEHNKKRSGRKDKIEVLEIYFYHKDTKKAQRSQRFYGTRMTRIALIFAD